MWEELVITNYNESAQRLQVFAGWIVKTQTITEDYDPNAQQYKRSVHITTVFVPDPQHLWSL